ncbi:MAG: hypothetical protein GYB31_19305 [Bacteroidetes bacterium]|nr:hypothetical protein [Bacteroidota bacterium]
MMKHLLILGCWFICASANGQSVLQQLVSVEYDNWPLQVALSDLDQRYGLTFSYSSDLIQMDVPVTASYQRTELYVVLDEVFEQSNIDYAEMNGLIILRNKPLKRETITDNRESSIDNEELQKLEELQTMIPPDRPPHYAFEPVGLKAYTSVKRQPVVQKLPQPDWAILRNTSLYGKPGPMVVQASVVPYLGNYMEVSDDITANLSFNLIWGVTGGIEGMELSPGVNVTMGHMRGLQMGGLANVVTGPVHGAQITTGMNVSEAYTHGLQMGGVSNHSRILQGAQIAGVANVVVWRAGGFQLAGVCNIAGGRKSSVTQISSLFNVNRGTSGFQTAGLINISGDVKTGQVSLINVAKEVDGFQLGLINIADTVAGPSIGLLNIVKRGYNRFDISSSEVLWVQGGWALGSPRFYNLIQAGYRGSDGRANASWGLGYGIGTRLFTGKRWIGNTEIYLWHINEEAVWTRKTNWLGQWRCLFEKEKGFMRHLYFGPVINISASKLNATENGLEGSKLAPYDLLDTEISNTKIKGWIGFNAGFRF